MLNFLSAKHLLVFFLSILFLSTAYANEPISLELCFEKGAKKTYHCSHDQKSFIKISSESPLAFGTTNLSIDYQIETIDVDEEGSGTIKIEMTRLCLDSNIPCMRPISYDSDLPKNSAIDLHFLSNLVGKSFIFTLSKEGKVISKESLNDFLDQFFDETEELDELSKNALKLSISELFSGKAFNQALDYTVFYQESSINKEESWNNKTLDGKEKEITCQLIDANEDNISLSFTGQISKPLSPLNFSNTVVDVDYLLDDDMQIKGTAILDTKTKWLVSFESTLHTKGKLLFDTHIPELQNQPLIIMVESKTAISSFDTLDNIEKAL